MTGSTGWCSHTVAPRGDEIRCPKVDVDQPDSAFRHEALLYHGADEFVSEASAFITAALAEEEPVMVAIPGTRIAPLRAALNGAAEQVEFHDMTDLGRNPARIIPAWRRFVDKHAADGRAVRGIGEPIWAGRRPAEIDECQRHEALLNRALAGERVWLMCPYDALVLDADVLEGAHRNHPHVCDRRVRRRSRRYVEQTTTQSAFAGELSPPPPDARSLRFAADQLHAVRAEVSECARQFGLGRDRASDLMLAVTELASNSIRHGGGAGSVSTWCEGEQLMVEVRDAGRIDDPLAGRYEPALDRHDGRGLWLVNQLSDLVQIRSPRSGGSVIRISIDRPQGCH